MKLILLFTSIIILLFLIACNKDETSMEILQPEACFSMSQNSEFYVEDTVKFSNCSENGVSYIWDFGDGNISTKESPWHVYQKGGNYIVRLFVTNQDSIATVSMPIQIHIPIPKACFSINQNSESYVGDTLKFSNCSENGDTFKWDFGDGNTSVEKSPWHVYQTIGNHIVKLAVTNKYLTDAISLPIYIGDKYFTLLHDTLLTNIPGYHGESFFYFDIDKDGIKDVKIETQNMYLRTLIIDYVNVTALNDYKTAYSEMTTEAHSECNPNHLPTTVMVPKLFDLGDIISIDSKFTSDKLQIFYYKGENNNLNNCYTYTSYGISRKSNYYIAFFKENGLSYKIAWLKVLATSTSSITLNSCYYSYGESLEINR